MKKLILAIAVSFCCVSQTEAIMVASHFNFQAPTNEEKVAKMTELLKLSKEQQQKYKALLVSSEKSKTELKEKMKTASKEDKKKLQDEYKKNYEAELSKILTPAQYTKLKEEAGKKK